MTNEQFEVDVRRIERMLPNMTDGQLAEVAKLALCHMFDQNSIPEVTWDYLDTLTDAELIG